MGRSEPDQWEMSGSVSNHMYNPINVKAGEAGKNGQPNMVSLTKLLDALMKAEIDSYYLLIVKMRLENTSASEDVDESRLVPDRSAERLFRGHARSNSDHVTFDSGPGQTMLKERDSPMKTWMLARPRDHKPSLRRCPGLLTFWRMATGGG